MIEKKIYKNRYKIAFVIISIVYFVFTFYQKDNLLGNSDVAFLVNRARQMLVCIKDGNVPFFYYDDFMGVGYGSSFFYGQLTLYPFMPILALFGKKAFILIYITIAYIIALFGIQQVTKRISKNYNFITVTFTLSMTMFQMINLVRMYANFMGIALAFWFIAFLIDFFKDNKKNSWVNAGIMFFLIINTHLLTAVICFIVTCCIMLYYFKKNQILQYLKFALFTVVLCSYFIANFFYHSICLNDLTGINQFVLKMIDTYNINAIGGIGGYILQKNYSGLVLFDIVQCILIIAGIAKAFKSGNKKLRICIILSALLLIFSIKPIWTSFNLKILTLPFQFSFRFIPFIMLFLYTIALDKIDSHNIRLFVICYSLCYACTYCCILGTCELPEYTDASAFTGNGEYVMDEFCCTAEEFINLSSSVTDEYGESIEYSKNAGVVTFECSEVNTYRLPVLWYPGYKAFVNDIEVGCSLGYSQFVEVSVPSGVNGTVHVKYCHPLFLQMMDFGCLLFVLISIMKVFKEVFYVKARSTKNC